MDEKKVSAIIALILFITAALLILIPEIPVIETQMEFWKFFYTEIIVLYFGKRLAQDVKAKGTQSPQGTPFNTPKFLFRIIIACITIGCYIISLFINPPITSKFFESIITIGLFIGIDWAFTR
jgi:hypothetical protein